MKTVKETQRIYLDNGATTQVAKEVIDKMNQYHLLKYGNASSLHIFGREAKETLDKSRENIAKAINASASEIIFTSGGSESDNLAIKGVVEWSIRNGNKKPEIIISAIEHPAVLKICEELQRKRIAKMIVIPVDKEGFVKLDVLKRKINKKTAIVSIMHANNEIGTIQPIQKIGEICEKKEVIFHTDAVQSFTKTKIDVKEQHIGMASFSAHKIHGPKGVGALYIKKDIQKKIMPQTIGGGHEFAIRAGTENIPGIAGFAEAVKIALLEEERNNNKMEELRDYLLREIPRRIPNVLVNGPALGNEKRLCNNANFSIKYIEGESLILLLDSKGIAASTGSACSQKSLKPSHVLIAIGLPHEIAHGSLRLTLSRYTTKEEVKYAVDCVEEITKHLRKISPLTK